MKTVEERRKQMKTLLILLMVGASLAPVYMIAATIGALFGTIGGAL